MTEDTLVSLWHSALRYDWRALHISDEGVHLIYLGKPNILLAFLGPIGGIIMQARARSAYKRAVAIPLEKRINLHPQNEFIPKERIKQIKGTSRRIKIATDGEKKYTLNRMGDGDLIAMTAKFTSKL